MTSKEIRELAKTVGGQCANHLAQGGSREACQEAAKALNAMADLVDAIHKDIAPVLLDQSVPTTKEALTAIEGL